MRSVAHSQIEGFEMRETPDTNGLPKLVFTRGTGAVPVWFVRVG